MFKHSVCVRMIYCMKVSVHMHRCVCVCVHLSVYLCASLPLRRSMRRGQNSVKSALWPCDTVNLVVWRRVDNVYLSILASRRRFMLCSSSACTHTHTHTNTHTHTQYTHKYKHVQTHTHITHTNTYTNITHTHTHTQHD